MGTFVLSPHDIGLPEKFVEWRPNQTEALEATLEFIEEYRYIPVSMPTGSGKSPWYIALALLLKKRTMILTKTKALQDQLMEDFECIGLTDIRGRANYQCKMAPVFSCEDGLHAKCPFAHDGRCEYKSAQSKALMSDLVVSNYAYWPLVNMFGDGLGNFDMLVLDEAAEAPMAVCSVMSVKLTLRDCHMLNIDWPQNAEDAEIGVWKNWCRIQLDRANREYEEVKRYIDAHHGNPPQDLVKLASRWKALVRKLTTVATAKGPWGVEPARGKGEEDHAGSGYLLEPLWADEYAESVLFQSIPTVVPVSATLSPKTMDLLGVGENQYKFQAYPYVFPVNRAPIYYIPTARMGQHVSITDLAHLYVVIDEIIRARLDRRGIIHCPSYQLRDDILHNSSFRKFMITHERSSYSTMEAIQRLKNSPPPAVLVSPVISTGYDFKYTHAEYQIIPKLPFPVLKGSRIMKARCSKKLGGDPEYADYLTVQQLQQACGRINRADDDQGETFILDSNLDFRPDGWVIASARKQFSSWFFSLYRPWRRKDGRLPDPPPRLEKIA